MSNVFELDVVAFFQQLMNDGQTFGEVGNVPDYPYVSPPLF